MRVDTAPGYIAIMTIVFKSRFNKPWSWENFSDGASLTVKQKREIRADAVRRGLIPDIPLKAGTKYPDFEAAGLVNKVDELPQELWKKAITSSLNGCTSGFLEGGRKGLLGITLRFRAEWSLCHLLY